MCSPNDPNVVDKIVAEIDKEATICSITENETVEDFSPSRRPRVPDQRTRFLQSGDAPVPKPTHWLNGRKPVIGIVCDDIQSTPLVGSKKFKNLCIKHRHVGAFEDGEPPIGCSLFIAIQNYTAQGNEGIPKAIRGNCNCVAVWKTGNWKELDLLATELSGVIPKEHILQTW